MWRQNHSKPISFEALVFHWEGSRSISNPLTVKEKSSQKDPNKKNRHLQLQFCQFFFTEKKQILRFGGKIRLQTCCQLDIYPTQDAIVTTRVTLDF